MRYVEFSGINPQLWEACLFWQKFHVCGWEKKRGRRGEERKRERRKRRRKRRRDPSEVIKIHFLFLIVVTLLITIIIN